MLTSSRESDQHQNRRAADARSDEPVDLKHLRRYTMGDVRLEQEVLHLFVGQLPQTIKSLSEAETDRDWKVAAHTLKGSGRAVGAWRVAALAERAERQAVKTDMIKAQAVARLEEAAEEVRAFISAAYPNAD